MSGKSYLGVIVDNNDETKTGRVKVKILEHSDEISDPDNVWAVPVKDLVFGSKGAGSFSYPKKGTLVRVNYVDKYQVFYENLEVYTDELKDIIKQSYENSQVLVVDADENLKIYYTKADGIMIFLKDSYINITPDAKLILEKSDENYIDANNVMVGHNASHPDTLCDKLIQLLMKMAIAIDSKVGPVTTITAEVSKAFNDICSKTVKIAD